jgi:hypothetical protein
VAVAAGVLFIAISAFAGRFFFQRSSDPYPEVRAPHALLRALAVGGEGVIGHPEYATPPGARNDLVAVGLPDACLVSDPAVTLGQGSVEGFPLWTPAQGSCEQTFGAQTGLPEHRRILATTAQSGYWILHLRSYPAWRVTVNGEPVNDLPRRVDGLMVVPVPQGAVDLRVDWRATPDVLAGRWVSALAALLLAGLFFVERKLGCSRLS